MKKWFSIVILAILALGTRGIALAVIFGIPVLLDMFIPASRSRRRKSESWPLTRAFCRMLFVSSKPKPVPVAPVPPKPVPVAPVPVVPVSPPVIPAAPVPAAPLGQRNSRYISNDVKAEVMRRDGGRCRRCGATEDLQFDHVIPWSRGGANTVKNIQLLCGACNRRKRDGH